MLGCCLSPNKRPLEASDWGEIIPLPRQFAPPSSTRQGYADLRFWHGNRKLEQVVPSFLATSLVLLFPLPTEQRRPFSKMADSCAELGGHHETDAVYPRAAYFREGHVSLLLPVSLPSSSHRPASHRQVQKEVVAAREPGDGHRNRGCLLQE